jgi:transposase
MIPPELHAQIRRLFFAEHWRFNTIADTLGVHHDTVRRAVESERFIRPGRQIRPSQLDPYKAFILATLDQYPRLRATRLWAMVRERGYPGSAIQVGRYVRTVRPAARAEAYLRLDTLPGEQAQVDWGNFGPLRVGSTTRLLSCFALVLSWSRACYARFALDQTLESFLRGHVEAFTALQGVPRTILYDNLKSVVLERLGDHIRFHPRVLELAGHYHYAPQPCAVARGNEKGRVERFLGFLRHSFFAARSFSAVDDLNGQLARWITEVAHARLVPGRRDQSVATALAEEHPRLLPLPEHPFACHLLRVVSSGKTPYIRFDGNDYSIPHTLVRRPLTLVASEQVVRLLDGSTEVAHHARSYDRGQRIEDEAHLAALVRDKRRAYDLRGRDRLRQSCPHADAIREVLDSAWSRGRESNPRPTDYESVALPLSYPGFSRTHAQRGVDSSIMRQVMCHGAGHRPDRREGLQPLDGGSQMAGRQMRIAEDHGQGRVAQALPDLEEESDLSIR